MRRHSYLLFVLAFILAVPAGAHAAAPEAAFEVSGWIPYWAASKGVKDARSNLDALSAIQPFTYSVKKDGSVQDLGNMKKSTWKKLLAEAKKEGVRVTPTVMWSDTANIHRILSDSKLRAAHVASVAEAAKAYDGIEIDYEGKKAETKPYFSLFLKELKAALGTKFLSCTIEARTPPESLYTAVSVNLEYANDYVEINKYCDRVIIMAYDQQRADIKLNAARAGQPYYPVADIEWVRKVMQLTAKSIDKNKLVIGVATYGRESEVTVSPNWFQSYKQLWSVSDKYAEDTADDFDITPGRNAAGELSYTYLPKKSKIKIPSSVKVPNGTPQGMETAARALAYANESGKTLTFNLVWWSDADAIAKKLALAKELGLRGVSIFKIDGGEDKNIWKLF